MSSTIDKLKVYANAAVGNVEQGVGKLVGSESLQARGKMPLIKGEEQQARQTCPA